MHLESQAPCVVQLKHGVGDEHQTRGPALLVLHGSAGALAGALQDPDQRVLHGHGRLRRVNRLAVGRGHQLVDGLVPVAQRKLRRPQLDLLDRVGWVGTR
jgi:hypothetical protein